MKSISEGLNDRTYILLKHVGPVIYNGVINDSHTHFYAGVKVVQQIIFFLKHMEDLSYKHINEISYYHFF